MGAYDHIRDHAVDWVHHDAIRMAENARRHGGNQAIWDSMALEDVERLADEGQLVPAATYARAYASTRRAIQIEQDDLRHSAVGDLWPGQRFLSPGGSLLRVVNVRPAAQAEVGYVEVVTEPKWMPDEHFTAHRDHRVRTWS